MSPKEKALMEAVSDLEIRVKHSREMGRDFLETPFDLAELERIVAFIRKVTGEPGDISVSKAANCLVKGGTFLDAHEAMIAQAIEEG